MNYLPSNIETTATELASKLDVSRQAVVKRLKAHPELIVRQVSNGGRPSLFYEAQGSAAIFGMRYRKDGELERMTKEDLTPRIGMEETSIKARKANAKRGMKTNKYGLDAATLNEITELIKYNYLKQAYENNLSEVCRTTLLGLYPNKNPEEMQSIFDYVYKRHLTLTNYYNEAPFKLWRKMHREKWKVNLANSKNPMLDWRYFELFESEGWAGEGKGANLIWVIDGTQYDSWVEVWDDEKQKLVKKLVSFLLIMDGLTGMPLWARPMVKGESVEAAAAIVMECALLHGVPKYGFVLDNGSAFKSPRFQAFLKKLCPIENLTGKEINALKTIFGGNEAPIYYPLARIPRFPFKAMIERLFGSINRFPAIYSPLSYQGGTDNLRIQIELGSTPTKSINAAPNFYESFFEFMKWLFFEFGSRSSGRISRHFKYKGLKSVINPVKAFEYYGGSLENVRNILTNGEFPSNPALDFAGARYFLAPESEIKRVTCNAKCSVFLTIGGDRVNLICDKLTYEFLGEKIAIAPQKINGEWRASLYLERSLDDKKYNALTPEPGDIYYIGEALDAVVRKLSDVAPKRELRKAAQKTSDAKIKEDLKPKIELTEYVLIEEDKPLQIPASFEETYGKAPKKQARELILKNESEEDAECWGD